MSRVLDLRRRYREEFEAKHGVKLGILSFFVKPTIAALKRIPELNAEIRGHDIVYRDYYDIGIAIGSDKGLIVPVLRDADRMDLPGIERRIRDFAERAGRRQLELRELEGGTFTISNGGVYGSMLSTPIVNPPQSGVLGLHAIEPQAVVRDGEIVARPIMYLALSYDHRIVDGREAIAFLKTIRDGVEEPGKLLLDL
jgi:2-oxoglutarate dehydrogenase E2 component (dihydrolipoamide succinyltransferase)